MQDEPLMNRMGLRPAGDPLKRGMRAEFAEHFAPLGTPMRFETNSADVLEACRESFGRYGAPSYEADGEPLKACFWVDSDFAEGPPWPDPVFRSHGAVFYVTVGRQNTAVADLECRSVTAFLSPAMAKDTAVLRRTFLECTVLFLLTHGARGLYSYVHASAVAIGRRGLLFSGPSGSGKSSLAYACARAGFDFVSDDVVYLRQDGADLAAWGRPWRLRLLQAGLALFPELAGKENAVVPGAETVVEFELDEILPCGRRASCSPAALLFLERSEGESTWETLGESEALGLLSRDLLFDSDEALVRHQRLWQALARRGAFRLRCANDLDALAARLRCWIDSRRDAP